MVAASMANGKPPMPQFDRAQDGVTCKRLESVTNFTPRTSCRRLSEYELHLGTGQLDDVAIAQGH